MFLSLEDEEGNDFELGNKEKKKEKKYRNDIVFGNKKIKKEKKTKGMLIIYLSGLYIKTISLLSNELTENKI